MSAPEVPPRQVLVLASEGRLYRDPVDGSIHIGTELRQSTARADKDTDVCVKMLRTVGYLTDGPIGNPGGLAPLLLTSTGMMVLAAIEESPPEATTTRRPIHLLDTDDFIRIRSTWYRCAGPAATTLDHRDHAPVWSIPVQTAEGRYTRVEVGGHDVTATLGNRVPAAFNPKNLRRKARQARESALALTAKADALDATADRVANLPTF